MKNGQSILKLLALIYLLVSAVLMTVGAAVGILVSGAGLYGIITGSIGFLFFVIGLILFVVYKQASNKKKKLMEAGQYVYAKVTDIDVNPHQQVQVHRIAMHPFYILCSYVDGSGNQYRFKSGPLLYNPSALLKSDQLKVYVNLSRPGRYYVDTNEILPETAVLHKFKYDSMRQAQQLTSAGKYVTAVTCGVELAGRITVNGLAKPGFLKLPESIARQFGLSLDERGRAFWGYTVLCRYTAKDGTIHIFASRGIRGEPDRPYIGEPVKVYYEGNNYRKYHVEL